METIYLNELLGNGYQPRKVRDKLREVVKHKIENEEEIFPGIYGIDREKRRITEVLMTGRGVLLTGQYGTAKTEISKTVRKLLEEYHKKHEVFFPASCPVQEEPFNIAYSLGIPGLENEGYKLEEACPICRNRYCNGNKADPKDIELLKFKKPVEGRGFARVQSGSDVTPDEIIGTYNLTKLAELGNPFDPEVFQPGKIGQASGGILFVDELGKLCESGQYALIQASEEGSVTPSKSRETFPVDELLITTTNPVDEDNIIGAVFDRLVSIKIPIVEYKDEIKILEKSLDKKGYDNAPYVPKLFRDTIVKTVRDIRKSNDELEIGPRTSINAGLVARESAFYDGREFANYCDMKEGIYTAILGKSFFDDKEDTEKAIENNLPEIDKQISNMFNGFNLDVGIEKLKELDIDSSFSPVNIKKALDAPEVKSFVDKVGEIETLDGEKLYEVVGIYYQACAQSCKNGQ